MSGGALAGKHGDDLLGGAIAKELAESFLVVPDAVLLDKGDEVRRRVTGEGGLGEVRICRQEVFRAGVEVGEIAPAATGDEDLLAGFFRMIQEDHTPAVEAGFNGTQEACSSSSDDDDVDCCRGKNAVLLTRALISG